MNTLRPSTCPNPVTEFLILSQLSYRVKDLEHILRGSKGFQRAGFFVVVWFSCYRAYFRERTVVEKVREALSHPKFIVSLLANVSGVLRIGSMDELLLFSKL